VVVPVVSVDALERMEKHAPSLPDNVLLEWIMILESFAAGKILKVLPFGVGQRVVKETVNQSPGSDEFEILDFFTEKIKDNLPKIAPTATLAQAAELLRANGIEPSEKMRSYTVHSIVHDMLKFKVSQVVDFPAGKFVSEFANKVTRLLNDCDVAALDAVVADHAVSAATAISALRAASPADVVVTPAAEPKQLKSLTVEELGRALVGVGMSNLVPVFAEKEVTGKLLANCEDVAELMSEDFGVATKAKARTLLEQVEEWRAQGVKVI
jgi:hypothetical protein